MNRKYNLKITILLSLVLFIFGCAVIPFHLQKENDFPSEQITKMETANDSILTETDSLEIIINLKNEEIDSLLSIVDEQEFTIDSLTNALEISNNRIAINQNFQIPDSIVFAGRIFRLQNERINQKFEKIYHQELKTAYKYIPRSGKYFAFFDSIFSQNGIPLDAKYLAVVESRLNPMATSRVGAAGIWQFMKKTAKGYGLKVNSFVDERRNVIKSTEAAAKYLKNNYSYLEKRGVKDWLLTMSAYNAGVGNIYKVIKQQGGKDFFDLILKADETHNYIWRAVAVKLIFLNEEAIFGKKFPRDKPFSEETRIEKIVLKGHYKIDNWAKAEGTSVSKIWEYNPWIKIYRRSRKKYSAINDVVLPPGKYSILLPKESVRDENAIAKIERQFLKKNAGYFTYHIVKKGDTLYDIARKYKTSVGRLKSLNRLSSNIIRPGQKLRLYGSVSSSTKSGKGYYIVKKGDSVGKIAKHLGVSSKHLIAKNNLKMKRGIVMIYPGQKLYY